MINPFDPESYYYNPERDGNLEEYLLTHSGHFGTFNLFKGYEWYEVLRERGYLIPGFSAIRLMWNVGREDEYFGVIDDFKLEGLQLPAHSGRKGIYDPKEILRDDGPGWEAHHLNLPDPEETAE